MTWLAWHACRNPVDISFACKPIHAALLCIYEPSLLIRCVLRHSISLWQLSRAVPRGRHQSEATAGSSAWEEGESAAPSSALALSINLSSNQQLPAGLSLGQACFVPST